MSCWYFPILDLEFVGFEPLLRRVFRCSWAFICENPPSPLQKLPLLPKIRLKKLAQFFFSRTPNMEDKAMSLDDKVDPYMVWRLRNWKYLPVAGKLLKVMNLFRKLLTYIYSCIYTPPSDSHQQDYEPCLVGNHYKPSCVTVTGWGVDQTFWWLFRFGWNHPSSKTQL